MKALGDCVTINAKYSTFDRMQGVIIEIVEDSHLKYTVQFDDGDECYSPTQEAITLNKQRIAERTNPNWK